LKCDEREKPGKESNRESSQVNRKWKENLRGGEGCDSWKTTKTSTTS